MSHTTHNPLNMRDFTCLTTLTHDSLSRES